LGQLPVEPRDLVIPLLECHMCPLKCGALLLEPALRFFSRQMLALEGSPGLGKGGPLLLELASAYWRATRSCRSCSSVVAREAALSAKLVLSFSASLSFSSA
jgi:hypothetical protein